MSIRISGGTIGFFAQTILDQSLYSVVLAQYQLCSALLKTTSVRNIVSLTSTSFISSASDQALATTLWTNYLQPLQAQVVAYKANPSPTLLSDIETLIKSW